MCVFRNADRIGSKACRLEPARAGAHVRRNKAYLYLQRLEARGSALCLRRAVLSGLRGRGRGHGGGQKLREGDAERRSRDSAALHVRVRHPASGEARLQMRCI